jgi:peroxiredoxin
VGVLPLGASAPDATLEDLAGRPTRLADLSAAGPALLVFFKATCPTCRLGLPLLEEHFQHSGRRARVIAVAQEQAEAARRFASEFELQLPILLDPPPYELSRDLDLEVVPTLMVLDPELRVVRAVEGFHRGDWGGMLRADLAALGLPAVDPLAGRSDLPELKPG